MLTADLTAELQQSDILRQQLGLEALFNFVSNCVASYWSKYEEEMSSLENINPIHK